MDPQTSSSKPDKSPSPGLSNNTFLFINESTSKAGKKLGRRTDIKSHVRNHIVSTQREKKNRTTDHRASNPSPENDVDENLPEDLKGKGKGEQPTGYGHASRSGEQMFEWNQATPLYPPSPSTGMSTSFMPGKSPFSVSFLQPTPEAGWYQNHRPSGQSQILSIPLPKPNVVSDVLERALALVVGIPSRPQVNYQEYGIPSSPRDSLEYLSSRRNSPLGSGYDGLQIGATECAICGDSSRAWMNCAQHGTVWERQRADGTRYQQIAGEVVKLQAFGSRPLDQLGKLGHGRVDPFGSYPTLTDDPTGTLHELIDHSVTYLLPGLVADGSSKSAPSQLSTAWMSAGLKSPLLFHALVFSASIHLSYLQTSTIHPNSTISLTHKQAVIYQLNQVLNSPTERIKDEVILAILILSSHEVMDLSPEEGKCFDSPLKRMQWLNVYGNIRNVQEHLMAVMNLVILRGGVESLELYGLAEMLLGGDVVAATTSLSKPAFQPLRRSAQWLSDILLWARSPPRLLHMSLASAFRLYTSHGLTHLMISLFDEIAAVTLGIEHHLSGELMGLGLTEIARTRTACQQKLLSLPTTAEFFEMPDEAPYLYEAVRLTANIYNIAVIFPIPRSSQVLQTLVQQLAVAIEEAELEKSSGEIPNILLWMLVLGGIAALGKVEREWYVEHLVGFVRKWELREWIDVEGVLGRFLWLDSACGREGRTLWATVADRRAFLETNLWLAESP